jgi:hypothetical protein
VIEQSYAFMEKSESPIMKSKSILVRLDEHERIVKEQYIPALQDALKERDEEIRRNALRKEKRKRHRGRRLQLEVEKLQEQATLWVDPYAFVVRVEDKRLCQWTKTPLDSTLKEAKIKEVVGVGRVSPQRTTARKALYNLHSQASRSKTFENRMAARANARIAKLCKKRVSIDL